MSWEDAWREGRIGWDAGASAPALHRLVKDGSLPDKGRALVPGCGSGYDVLTLAEAGHPTVGVDLAPVAAERFRTLREERGLGASQASVVVGDFFGWAPEARFDLIWDYTFFCAIPPELRADWVRKMDALLASGGELITLIFPVGDFLGPSDPPYRVSPELLQESLSPIFVAHTLERVEESHAGRLGHEWLGRWHRA
ncbi:MAG: methyltransferase domain-containing protein [Myxococcota bacterium]